LYQPLGESEADEESEEELLPTHNASKAAKLAPNSAPWLKQSKKNPRLGNVWDSREDFDLGSASEEEEQEGRRKPTEPFTPQIVVSHTT